MRKSPDKELIQEIALEKGIAPAFIEKDWHAVQLLSILSQFQNDKNVQLIFSGGTSLSKGYNLIKRFSEDLDFILYTSDPNVFSVGQRRSLRKEILQAVMDSGDFQINPDAVQRGDSHRFFKVPITYHKVFDDAVLRPHLQLEMTFSEPKLPPEPCRIQSFVSEALNEEPELTMNCVSPLETAGDKLSALTWRVLIRDRAAVHDDATMIRHLHDLAALAPSVFEGRDTFIKSARLSLEQDRARRGGDRIAALPPEERLTQALAMLQGDALYRMEYTQFVESMSYADEAERLDFDNALRKMEEIVGLYRTSLGG